MKKLIIACVLGVVLGVCWNYMYNGCMNPTLRFWGRCADTSDKWAEQLRRSPEPCYVFAGGSETRIGIDPQYAADNSGLRVINAGCQAGFTPLCHIETAMSYLRPGDTLLVTLNGYDFNLKISKIGLQFLWQRMGINAFRDGLIPPTYSNIRSVFAGDAGTLSFCLIKKVLYKGPVYNYETDSYIHPSGWMEILRNKDIKMTPAPDSSLRVHGLPSEKLQAMAKLRKICDAKGIKLVLWNRPIFIEDSYRHISAMQTLSAVRNGFCVLKDARLGAVTDKAFFSDSLVHPSKEGVRQQMQIIGQALKNKDYWTEEELLSVLRSYGYDAEGKKITP